MTIKYATLLAGTKFRTRLGRSIMTVIAAALVAGIMVIASFSFTGLENALKEIGNGRIASLNLVRDSVYFPTDGLEEEKNQEEKASKNALSLGEYKNEIAAKGATDAFEQVYAGEFTLIDPKPSASSGQDFMGQSASDPQRVAARSEGLYSRMAPSNPVPAAEGTVPALISRSVLLQIAGVSFGQRDSSTLRVQKTKETVAEWTGKVLTWQRSNEDGTTTELKTTLQGLLSSGELFGGIEDASVIMPLEKARQSLSFPAAQDATFFAAFPDEASQLAYIEGIQEAQRSLNFGRESAEGIHWAMSYGNPMLQFREMRDSITDVLKYIIGALLVAVAIAMLTTLSKIISDSERETGVFRAIGARSADMLQIYLTYSAFVAALAMLVATAVATGLGAYLTSRFGPLLSYQLITLTSSDNLELKVTFLGVNGIHLIGVFFAILLASVAGTLLPLVGMLRRDPIKALRAE